MVDFQAVATELASILDIPSSSTSGVVKKPDPATAEFINLLFSKRTWNSLSGAQRIHLQQLLPASTDITDVGNLLDEQKNFGAGQILKSAKTAIAATFGLRPDLPTARLAAINRGLTAQRRIRYERWLRQYNVRLLQKLLINRRNILRSRISSFPDKTLLRRRVKQTQKDPAEQRRDALQAVLKQRAKKRVKLMLGEIKESVDDRVRSSDESDQDESQKGSDYHAITSTELWKAQREGINSKIHNTLTVSKFKDVALSQEIKMKDVDTMLNEYKLLKAKHQGHPSLDFSDISFADVVHRSEMDTFVNKFAPLLMKPPNPPN